MDKNFPQDEFDAVAPAAGRRRARRSAGAKLGEFFAYFFVSALVFGGGLYGYQTFFGASSDINVNSLSDNGKANVDPIRINETTVIDGVGQGGLASSVAHKLLDKGWNVVTAEDLPAGTTAAKTIIYINSDQLQNAANTLTADLGSYQIQVSNQYLDPITVVLGSDYK